MKKINKSTEFLFKKVVEDYYYFVDNNDLDLVYKIFSSNIKYKRCEEKIYGIDNLKKFYEQERKIKGIHIIKDIVLVMIM